jgi:hypothetical protein
VENLGGNASGVRLKALQGMGQKNPDADHAKQCGKCLDHSNCPLCPAETKQHGRPNSQKDSMSRNGFAGRLMISGNRACQEDGKTRAESRYVHRGYGVLPDWHARNRLLLSDDNQLDV